MVAEIRVKGNAASARSSKYLEETTTANIWKTTVERLVKNRWVWLITG
jgi:hypothetical protein